MAILSIEKSLTLKKLTSSIKSKKKFTHNSLIKLVGGIFINSIKDKNTNQNILYSENLKTFFDMRNQVIYQFPDVFCDIENCYEITGYIFDFAFEYIEKINNLIQKKNNLSIKENINFFLKEYFQTGHINDYISNTGATNVKTFLNNKGFNINS
ncbi:MAG: hypothetical protein ACFE9T_16205 [Promethearchaeota archaeon]